MKAVYLIHLETPLGNPNNKRAQAEHYLGGTKDLFVRLEKHRNNTGAKLLKFANLMGIRWHVVKVWFTDTPYALEEKLKHRKNNKKLCPICSFKKGK